MTIKLEKRTKRLVDELQKQRKKALKVKDYYWYKQATKQVKEILGITEHTNGYPVKVVYNGIIY